MYSIKLKLLFLFVLLSSGGYSQVLIQGMVADSVSFLPLQGVAIKVKDRGTGTLSDSYGQFKITVTKSDTLLFSMVGYKSKKYSAKELTGIVVVYLSMENLLLKPITIESTVQIPDVDKAEYPGPWKNPSLDYARVPGFQGLETFGPGYKSTIGWDKFFDKEKKKLKKLQVENSKAERYIELVNSADIKAKIMTDYSLTEDNYYRLLAIFNEKNKDIIYELDPESLTSLIFIFYAQNANKK